MLLLKTKRPSTLTGRNVRLTNVLTSSYSVPNDTAIIRRGSPNGGVECKGVWKKSWFSTNVSLYLRNDTRHSYTYDGRSIVSRTAPLLTTLNDP